jgi:hypothetical protein
VTVPQRWSRWSRRGAEGLLSVRGEEVSMRGMGVRSGMSRGAGMTGAVVPPPRPEPPDVSPLGDGAGVPPSPFCRGV